MIILTINILSLIRQFTNVTSCLNRDSNIKISLVQLITVHDHPLIHHLIRSMLVYYISVHDESGKITKCYMRMSYFNIIHIF